METVINVTVGTEVEGVKASSQFIGLVYPDMTGEQVAAAVRNQVKLAMLNAYITRYPHVTWQEALNLVNQHVIDTN